MAIDLGVFLGRAIKVKLFQSVLGFKHREHLIERVVTRVKTAVGEVERAHNVGVGSTGPEVSYLI